MNNKEKLDLINSIGVIDFSGSCDEGVEYILVANTKENRNKLYKVGSTFDELENECYCFHYEEVLNIAPTGFKIANMWWEYKGFYNE